MVEVDYSTIAKMKLEVVVVVLLLLLLFFPVELVLRIRIILILEEMRRSICRLRNSNDAKRNSTKSSKSVR